MSDARKCSYCNADIKGDASSCPCGVFYHPVCLAPAINKSTGKRKYCSHKPSSRSLSPNTSNNVTIEKISQILSEHYEKAEADSEKFIGDKINIVEKKISELTSCFSFFE